jgi:hypothetical protein
MKLKFLFAALAAVIATTALAETPLWLRYAKISPDGKHVAYVSKNNIYIEDCNMQTPNRRQLTTDGNDTIVNGTFDWVYEEEFDCRDGFRWSGDSRYIAFWRSNTSGTGWFDIINNVDDSGLLQIIYKYSSVLSSAVLRDYVINVIGPKMSPLNRWDTAKNIVQNAPELSESDADGLIEMLKSSFTVRSGTNDSKSYTQEGLWKLLCRNDISKEKRLHLVDEYIVYPSDMFLSTCRCADVLKRVLSWFIADHPNSKKFIRWCRDIVVDNGNFTNEEVDYIFDLNI